MKSKVSFLIYLFVILALVGCKTNKEKENFKQKDKAPDSLKELSKLFDEIFDTIDKIEKVQLGLPIDIEEPKVEKESNSQEKDSKSSSSEGESSSSEGDKNSSSDSKDKPKEDSPGGTSDKNKEILKDETLKLSWKKIDEALEKAHGKWNDFEVDGIKKGITREKSEQFQTSFNKMTKSVEERAVVDIYDYGSQSIKNLKPFYDLYLDEIGGEVSTLKYIAYQSYIRAISDDIFGALSLFGYVEEEINRLRIKIGDKEEKVKALNKANNSLLDMEMALEEQSKKLFMIKKDLIIKNLKELE